MTEKPELFDPKERVPDTSRPGGRSWIFQGATGLTMQYSEIFGDPDSSTHVHEDYEQIIMVLQGKANFWCGEQYYELAEGCVMVCPPGVPHGIQKRTDSSAELRVLELFCPADRQRPESPCAAASTHLNW